MTQRVSIMQVLVMRAIAEMPAGASPGAIQAHVNDFVGLRNASVPVVLGTLLRNRYILERIVRRPGMLHAPLAFYSLTPAGWAKLKERSTLKVQVPPLKAAAEVHAPEVPRVRKAAPVMKAAPRPAPKLPPAQQVLPRWRKPTPSEARRAGLKPWQVHR